MQEIGEVPEGIAIQNKTDGESSKTPSKEVIH